MAMSSYDDELLQQLGPDFDCGTLNRVETTGALFGRLAQTYPVHGSKIDWQSVPGAVVAQCSVYPSRGSTALEIREFLEFYDLVVDRFGLYGKGLYMGDGPMELGVGGQLRPMRSALPSLFQVPQHHYLIDPDFAWCFTWTMEGDMAFGFRPSSRQ
jgi:hypothetical protein